MEEEFLGGACGGNWWSSSINLFTSLPCSGSVNDLRWQNPSPIRNKTTKVSCDDDSGGSSGSSIVLQEPQNPQLNVMTHDWNQDLLIMGEEFQTGNWWSPSINLFSSLPCSGTANDLRWLNPSPMLHNKTTKVSCDDDSAGSSGSSIVLQEPQQPQLNMMTHDWNQDLLHDSAISQENYSHMLQTVNSSMNCRQEHACQSVFFEQHPSNSFSPSTATASFQDLPPASFPGSYGYTTSLLQTNFDADSHHHQVLLDSSNFGMNSAGLVVPERNNFQFVYNSPSGDIPASFLPQLVPSALTKGGQNRINFYSKHHNGKAWQAESVMKKGGNEPLFKRKRIETPSPLQTFKVRKEKLGDRLTALQQLVSPFGKTDTASVLHEAIEYIKLLHDQVTMLSAPYLKRGQPPRHRQQSLGKINNQEEPKKDLRSRGLCIVPMSITFPVAAETTADFWTSKPGRNFR